MNRTIITVITVCYNSEKTIDRCIKSVINQDCEGVEYIIIDGNSKDKTLDIINKYKEKNEFIRFISEKDNGIYDAMNKGLKMSKGEWIIFINSDDWMEENIIANIKKKLINSTSDAIYGDIRRVDVNEKLINIAKPSKNIDEKIRIGMPVFHQAIFIRRSVYDSLNGFDTRFNIAGDWDFISRMYCNKYIFEYMPIIFSSFTVGGASNNSHIIERHNVRKKNKFYKIVDLLMIKEIIVSFKNKVFK